MSEREEMEKTIGAMLDGAMAPEHAIEILSGLEEKQITPEQLAGAVDAVMARAVPFPAFPDAVDCCGTGGDGKSTLNISTATAVVTAACDVTVAKHGNRAITSKSGSADVLEALGVKTNLSPERAEQVLSRVGICFLFAPNFHPGLARVADIRKQIGKRTIFNLLGPLCNPARVERQLIGVFSSEACLLVAETARLLGFRRAMVAHGGDGNDEMSIFGKTRICDLTNQRITHHEITPADAGLIAHSKHGLDGGDAKFNAAALRDVLDGEENVYADAVVLNTAALLQVADKATSLEEGAAMAHEAIASGAAHAKLGELVEASHG